VCLSSIVQVVDIDPARTSATVDDDGMRRRVSLAVLAFDGPLPEPGDWLVAHTGLAVERLTIAEATTIRAARAAIARSPSEGAVT
jgi:hydrogenase assembly chaperone HypC/HupF